MDFIRAKRYILEYMQQHISKDLLYHGLNHTLSVVSAAGKLCVLENIGRDKTRLVLTAALLHDIGFLAQYDKNEWVACEYCHSTLSQFDYTPGEIQHICAIIMATELPQNPTEICAEIVCDADLSYLGTKEYFHIATSLRAELEYMGRIFEQVEWLQFQINFIEAHHYHTNSAVRLYEPIKMKNLAELHKQIIGLGRGNGSF